MKCHNCGTPVKMYRQRLAYKKHYCSQDCKSEKEMGTRNMDNVRKYLALRAEGAGFNEACRRLGISKFTASRIHNGFYDMRIPHNKWGKIGVGFFDVHEMEWL